MHHSRSMAHLICVNDNVYVLEEHAIVEKYTCNIINAEIVKM